MSNCCSHGTFLHFGLQSSHLNICYYQSVWRGGEWSGAVCSVGIFLTSFQPSQLEIWGLARSTRGTRSTRSARSTRSGRSTRTTSFEERSWLVPMWITSTGKEKSCRSAQMLQEENNWSRLWCGKSFSVPVWIATWKLLLDCSAQILQEERIRAIVGKSFSVPMWILHRDYFLTVLHRCHKQQEKKV